MVGDLLPTTPPVRRSSQRWIKPAAAIGIGAMCVAIGIAVFSGKSDESSPAKVATPSGQETPATGELSGDGLPSDEPSGDVSPPTTEIAQDESVEESATESSTSKPRIDKAQENITITETDCSWDSTTTNLHSSGTLVNRNPDGYRVYVSATWYSADGTELNGAADQWFVDGGGEAMEWELLSYSDDAPTGLRCELTIEVLF